MSVICSPLSEVVHKTAIIDPTAQLHKTVQVGPYAVIGAHTKIGAHSRIGAHAVIGDQVTLGEYNHVFQFASLGAVPQTVAYNGESTGLVVGDHNVFREFVTINASELSHGPTRIGSHGFFMAYTHIAHHCDVGDQVIFANGATLGGHVHVGDHVFISAYVTIHQFCSVGESAMLGRQAFVQKDIMPYCLVVGNPGELTAINVIGLKRRGFTPAQISLLRRIFRQHIKSSFSKQSLLDVLQQQVGDYSFLQVMIDFIHASERGLARASKRIDS